MAAALNLTARAGVGFEFLRIRRSSESEILVGYAFELGAGLWFATGPMKIGGEIAFPFGINGNGTVDDFHLDAYLSVDVDVLLGVRYVWR